jgi:hypothetical protein
MKSYILYIVTQQHILSCNYALNTNLMHKLSFIRILLQFLYMFRAINAHLQEVILYTCSPW